MANREQKNNREKKKPKADKGKLKIVPPSSPFGAASMPEKQPGIENRTRLPTGTGGSVQKKMRCASTGARFIQP